VGLLAGLVELLLTDAANVGEVAGLLADAGACFVVVGLVQAEVLDDLLGIGALDHD
jgi:hypothetical protein